MYLIKGFATILCVVLLSMPRSLPAATVTDPEVSVLARSDGSAYILHNYAIPLSHGYHVHRKVENGEWIRLTEDPVYPVQNGYQLESLMGNRFDFIRRELERDDPQDIFLTLRAQTGINSIVHAAVPELALLLGRAYLDEKAPAGSRVSYRITILDDLGRPSGVEMEHSTILSPPPAQPPSQLIADHLERTITLEWHYPSPDQAPETGHIIRFHSYYRDLETEEVVSATDALLVRRSDETQYREQFTVPELEKEYEFWVEAIDYSGWNSSVSDVITLYVEDNVPPSIVQAVHAEVKDAYENEIIWPVSLEADLAGYHVYVARGEEEEYTRLTSQILPPLETYFLHRETEPGVQYRYAVTAVDQKGNEGLLSNPAHVYVWDDTAPEAVTGLKAVFQEEGKMVELQWEANDFPDELKTYQILRRQIHPESGSVYDQLNSESHTETTWADKGYENMGFREGATMEYGIVAIGQNGNRSDTVRTYLQIPDLTPPDPPANLQVRMESGERVQLSWSASVSGDVTSYRIYRREAEVESPVLLAEHTPAVRTYRDQAAVLNGVYHYAVSAVDSLGNESVPLVAEPFTVHLLHPPTPSRNVQALYLEGRATLQWQVQNGDQIAGFRIYRSDLATGIFELIGEAASDARSYQCDGTSLPGQWFRVFPVDATGREARTARAVQATERTTQF